MIAGWTGRDVAALNHHIEELKAIGVQPPSKVPLYYRVAASLLTQAEAIQVVGDDTSGEAEPVLVGTADRLWVTVGADHTDRKLESLRRRPVQAGLPQGDRPHRLALRGGRAALGPADPAQLHRGRRQEGPVSGRPFGQDPRAA